MANPNVIENDGDDDAPEATVDRRAMLSQQFDDVQAEQPDAGRDNKEAGRGRDETGKFTPKTSSGAGAGGGDLASATPSEEPAWKKAPASWKKEHHEAWAKADPALQQYAWQREEEMRRGVEPLKTKAQLADEITQVSAPYQDYIRGRGISLPQAVEGLMRTDHVLRTSTPEVKRQFIMQLARGYGVDLSQPGQPQIPGQRPQQQNVDPNYYALQNELQTIRGEVTSWKQQQERAQDEAILNEINDFASKAEHFEDVRDSMTQLLQSGVAATLQEAYDKAVRLDDRLFETIQSRKQADEDAKKRSSADKAAKAAKAAALSVKSSTPGAQPKAKAQDRRSLLAEQFDEVSDRL